MIPAAFIKGWPYALVAIGAGMLFFGGYRLATKVADARVARAEAQVVTLQRDIAEKLNQNLQRQAGINREIERGYYEANQNARQVLDGLRALRGDIRVCGAVALDPRLSPVPVPAPRAGTESPAGQPRDADQLLQELAETFAQ